MGIGISYLLSTVNGKKNSNNSSLSLSLSISLLFSVDCMLAHTTGEVQGLSSVFRHPKLSHQQNILEGQEDIL